MAQRARFVGNAEGESRPGARHDPAVRLLMEHVDAGHITVGEVTQEITKLRRFGIAITPELMQRAIDLAIKTREGLPPQKPTQPRVQTVHGGRWDGIRTIGDVVYYMRIGNRVKIGTTSNLGLRLKAINPEELMATEPGNTRTERSRHVQFKSLRTAGEWFKLESPLTEHIGKLRGKQ